MIFIKIRCDNCHKDADSKLGYRAANMARAELKIRLGWTYHEQCGVDLCNACSFIHKGKSKRALAEHFASAGYLGTMAPNPTHKTEPSGKF